MPKFVHRVSIVETSFFIMNAERHAKRKTTFLYVSNTVDIVINYRN